MVPNPSVLPPSKMGKLGMVLGLGVASSIAWLWLAWLLPVALPAVFVLWPILPGFKAVEALCNGCDSRMALPSAIAINAALWSCGWYFALRFAERFLRRMGS